MMRMMIGWKGHARAGGRESSGQGRAAMGVGALEVGSWSWRLRIALTAGPAPGDSRAEVPPGGGWVTRYLEPKIAVEEAGGYSGRRHKQVTMQQSQTTGLLAQQARLTCNYEGIGGTDCADMTGDWAIEAGGAGDLAVVKMERQAG